MKKWMLFLLLFAGSNPLPAVVFQTGQQPVESTEVHSVNRKNAHFQSKTIRKSRADFQKKRPLGPTDWGKIGLVACVAGFVSSLCLMLAFTGGPVLVLLASLVAVLGMRFIRKSLRAGTEAEWHTSLMALIFLLPALLTMWLYGCLLVLVVSVIALPTVPMAIRRGRYRPNPLLKTFLTWFPRLIGEFISTRKDMKNRASGAKSDQ